MKTLNKTNGVYHAFGLNIDSELLFPDMPKISGTTDVVIQYGPVPEAIPDASLVGVRYQAAPRAFLLRVDGIASYYVKNGRTIIIEPENGAAEEEIRLFLLGSVMGGLLHQRGILPCTPVRSKWMVERFCSWDLPASANRPWPAVFRKRDIRCWPMMCAALISTVIKLPRSRRASPGSNCGETP